MTALEQDPDQVVVVRVDSGRAPTSGTTDATTSTPSARGTAPGDSDGEPGYAPPTAPDQQGAATDSEGEAEPAKRPLYPRLLRLRHVHPNAWQRAVLGEGAVLVALLLVAADLASLWMLLVLPLTVALVVKGHDLLAGALRPAVEPSLVDGAPGTTTLP